SGPIWVRHAFLLVEMNDPLNAHPSDPESFEPMNRHGEDPSRPGSPSDNRVRFREALLLEQIRAGDAGAARHFVADHYPRIYRYLLYLTGRREMAEDLTQETFLQAWRYLDRFVPHGSLGAWLHRIAHREFLQALRSKGRILTEPEAASLDEIADL